MSDWLMKKDEVTQILRLRVDGLTYAEIALQLKITSGLAAKVVKQALAEQKALEEDLVEDLRAISANSIRKQLSLLRADQQKLEEKDEPPSIASVGMVIKLEERLAKLLGLDRGVEEKKNINLNIGKPVTEIPTEDLEDIVVQGELVE